MFEVLALMASLLKIYSFKEVLSVYSLTRKIVVTGLFSIVLVASSVAQAGVNPFKKSKNYNFNADVSWYENSGAAIKSGTVRDGGDVNYYHLNIDQHRMLLRLGKNDPSGELIGTRLLGAMAITDVIVDGRQLPIFGWCLKNQQMPGKKLKQNAVVANDTCVNAGGAGDFVINLNANTKSQLKNAQTVEFLIEPYGRPVKLSFSMAGYAPLMAKINKPVAPPVVKKAVVATPKPKPKVKPKPKPKPKAKPKVAKMCNAKPAAEFKSRISAVPYPCADAKKKSAAESRVAAQVESEKMREAVKLKAAIRKQKAKKKAEPEPETRQEAEWDDKQSKLWVSRCERHWKKGVSPCYCEKYISKAPSGVENTCAK